VNGMAIRYTSFVCLHEALHKDGEDGDHHKIGGMMVEFTVEPSRWRPL
jgi:hypothetical protein